MKIEGSILDEGGLGIGKIGSQVGIQRRLIVFDAEKALTSQRINALHEIFLGMKGVGGTDSSSQWDAWQKRLSNGNLVGFLGDRDLEKGFLALMGPKRKQ